MSKRSASVRPVLARACMTRRTALASAAVVLVPTTPSWAQDSGISTVTVLYRKEQSGDLDRRDSGALAAASQIEQGLNERRFRVVRPSADVLALTDRTEEIIINFDPGAGACVLLSCTRVSQPQSGGRTAIELRARAQVYFGPSLILAGDLAEGVGYSQAMVPGPDAARRAVEVAARDASKALANRIADHLQSLGPQRLAELARPSPPLVTGSVVLPHAPKPPAIASQPASGQTGSPSPAAISALPAVRRRFALIVGVSDFRPVANATQGRLKPNALPGVERDVRGLAATALKLGFAPEDVTVLFNAEATSANVRGHLMSLAGKLQPDDLVLVAFSSHGAPAPFSMSGYGLPILSDYAGPGDKQALDFWQVQGLIGNLPCRQVVLVVDTCHSGGVAQHMPRLTVDRDGRAQLSSGTVTPEPARMAGQAADPSRHFAIVAASQPDQESLELPGVGGLFTSRLLRSLEANRGASSISDLMRSQVQPQVIEHSRELCRRTACSSPEQTPVFAYSGRGDLIRL
jgi:hypothetical protein